MYGDSLYCVHAVLLVISWWPEAANSDIKVNSSIQNAWSLTLQQTCSMQLKIVIKYKCTN